MLHIVVSSAEGYQAADDVILRSLAGAESVTVFVSNTPKDMWSYRGRIHFGSLNNRFDHTALVGVVENELFEPEDWVMLLHNTMEATPDLLTYPFETSEERDAYSFWGNGFCSVGIYSVHFLRRIRDRFCATFNHLTKKQAIELEGSLFRDPSWEARTGHYSEIMVRDTGRKEIVYPGGSERLVEAWETQDGALLLQKFKANYGQTNENSYILRP